MPIKEYSLFIDTPACSRGWGWHSTPDEPWVLKTGKTWADCFDSILDLQNGYAGLFISQVALDDFMSGIPGMMLFETEPAP